MAYTKREKLHKLLCKAPKPQLHFHLDGSLSYSFIRKSIERLNETCKGSVPPKNYFFGSEKEPQNAEELRQWLMELKTTQIQNGSVVGKNSNWKTFDFSNQFLQTAQGLSSAAYEIVSDIQANHNVNYIEIRFAPVLHTMVGLKEEEAVLAVAGGFKQAVAELSSKNIAISGGVILCALRSYPVVKAFETLELCKKKIPGVVGFDIAGDEGSYPLSLFREVLIAAKSSAINVTTHAGEWDEKLYPSSLENVKLALELNLDRIGHGLAIRSADQQLIEELKQEQIAVEICVTGNCGNPSKCKSLADHPLPIMLRQGINVAALNVDNMLISGNEVLGAPNPTDECVRALLDCGLSPMELMLVIENGYKAGFANDKATVMEDAIKEWNEYYVPEITNILK